MPSIRLTERESADFVGVHMYIRTYSSCVRDTGCSVRSVQRPQVHIGYGGKKRSGERRAPIRATGESQQAINGHRHNLRAIPRTVRVECTPWHRWHCLQREPASRIDSVRRQVPLGGMWSRAAPAAHRERRATRGTDTSTQAHKHTNTQSGRVIHGGGRSGLQFELYRGQYSLYSLHIEFAVESRSA